MLFLNHLLESIDISLALKKRLHNTNVAAHTSQHHWRVAILHPNLLHLLVAGK
jgi:hypothetical protein